MGLTNQNGPCFLRSRWRINSQRGSFLLTPANMQAEPQQHQPQFQCFCKRWEVPKVSGAQAKNPYRPYYCCPLDDGRTEDARQGCKWFRWVGGPAPKGPRYRQGCGPAMETDQPLKPQQGPMAVATGYASFTTPPPATQLPATPWSCPTAPVYAPSQSMSTSGISDSDKLAAIAAKLESVISGQREIEGFLTENIAVDISEISRVIVRIEKRLIECQHQLELNNGPSQREFENL
jgi:hypothetical protein